jgi:hypothetical protein
MRRNEEQPVSERAELQGALAARPVETLSVD